jgi:pyruvate/2-oxoglutarate dehydrogenase complex dihydrolipoamide dehydrogenase (E3) component
VSQYASFTSIPKTVQSQSGELYTADNIVIAVGGAPNELNVPGGVSTTTHLNSKYIIYVLYILLWKLTYSICMYVRMYVCTDM